MVMAVLITVPRLADASESRQLPSIRLQMDNDAAVPAAMLQKSQEQVTRIFAAAGLGVEWTETGPRFTVQIVPNALGYARTSSPVMGVVERKPSGATAHIFFHEVQDFARRCDVEVDALMAYVIAHEIGHLLLPRTPHSVSGLMKADWDTAFVRAATSRSMTFTDAQVKRILGSADAAVGSPLASR